MNTRSNPAATTSLRNPAASKRLRNPAAGPTGTRRHAGTCDARHVA